MIRALLADLSAGLTEESLGTVASAGVLCYAAGKVVNGVLADYVGGRALFLFGMAASAVCTVLFGLAGGLTAFTLAWAANRYVQSMGWGGLVQVASRWYPAAVQATHRRLWQMSIESARRCPGVRDFRISTPSWPMHFRGKSNWRGGAKAAWLEA